MYFKLHKYYNTYIFSLCNYLIKRMIQAYLCRSFRFIYVGHSVIFDFYYVGDSV